MVEFRPTGSGQVVVIQDDRETGEARWGIKELSWGRERVKVACLDALTCPKELMADLWDHLCYLWQKEAVAAVYHGETLAWFSRALERSWQAAGSPLDFHADSKTDGI